MSKVSWLSSSVTGTAQILVFAVFLVCWDHGADAKFAEDLSRLRKKLAAGYSRSIPPRNDDSKPVEIMMMSLVTSAHFDAKTQTLSAGINFAWEWVDSRLSWIPEEFGGAQKIHLAATDVWVPEVTLVNGARTSDPSTFRQSLRFTRVTVAKNGTVLHWPSLHTETRCANADLSEWPAETVTCSVVFAAVTWIGHDPIHFVHPYKTQPNKYVRTNPDWAVISVNYYDMHDTQSSEPVLVVDITLRRSATRAKHTFTVPILCAVILTLVGIALSPDNRERWLYIGFNIMFLMALVFYEKSATGAVQKGPLILNFLRDLVILQLVLAIETIIINYLWAQQSVWSFQARNILQTVTSYALCMDCGSEDVDQESESAPTTTAAIISRAKSAAMLPLWFIKPEDRLKELQSNPEYRKSSGDWLLLGLAVDKIMAYVFLLVMVISAAQNWPPALVPTIPGVNAAY